MKIKNSALLETLFASVSIEQLKAQLERQLKKLSELNCGSGTDEDKIYEALKDCMLIQHGEFRSTAYPSTMRLLSSGQHLFRARKLKAELKPLGVSDFWEAPAEHIEYGRLNMPRQPLLYACDDPFTPLYEARIGDGDLFLLTKYQITGSVEIIETGMSASSEMAGLSVATRQKLELVKGFIDERMLNTEENAYRVSSILANELHNFGPDGWCYPSVVRRGGTNFCLKLHTKSRLNITGAVIGRHIAGKNFCTQALRVDEAGKILTFTDWSLESSNAKDICNAIFLQDNASMSEPPDQDAEPIESPIRVIR